MTVRSRFTRFFQQEDVNFLLTNRIPRRLLTQFMGWFSRIENPVVRDLSIGAWRFFADLDLRDAKKQRFRSMHDCFTRELKDGARPVDAEPRTLVSPCDGIVGASGTVHGDQLIQAKGFPYRLHELFGGDDLASAYIDGCYVTLRLTSSMYHRFHAPHDCRATRVTYISGDTWNVNPIALKRVEKLFCRNERALVSLRLDAMDATITLVPVAAILVASIRLHFADVLLHLKRQGPNVIPCDAALRKGEEMGWFQHGSTIIVFAPKGFSLCANVREGDAIRMGQGLLRMP